MRKKRGKKQLKTDEWNERSRYREEKKTREADKDWNKKNEEMSEDNDIFHEGDYDT